MLSQDEIDKCEYINVGCGTTRFDNCVNMDIADNALIDYDIIGSVLSIPFPDERFKGVIFSHVLEHLEMRFHKRALQEIRRVLKDNGTIYIDVPDFEKSIKFFLDNKQGRKDWWYYTIFGRGEYEGDIHKSGITREYLTDILFDTGFRIKSRHDLEPDFPFITMIVEKIDLPDGRLK